MRVLHVVQQLRPSGAATQLRLLAASGAAAGDTVTVATLRYPGRHAEPLRSAGVRVEWLGGRFAVDPFACLRLGRLVRRLRPDVVQSWDEDSARTCRLDTPRVTRQVPVCRSVPRENEGGASDGGQSLPNAVDPAIADAAIDRSGARRTLRDAGVDLTDQSPVVALVTRLDDAWGVKELVWASDLLRVVRPGLRLLVVGSGPAEGAAQRFADAATERGTVVWLGDRIDRAIALAAADVVWSLAPSSQSTSVLEALAAGRSVVAPAANAEEGWASREFLATLGEATLAPPLGDRAGWARVTDRLLADRDAASESARAAWRRLAIDHALHVVARRHRETLGAA